jgi:hypothetical protein
MGFTKADDLWKLKVSEFSTFKHAIQ